MRKICIFTGTRADYGLLKPLMKAIESEKDLKLQILASGSHFVSELGNTYKEIEEDFKIDEKVENLLFSDSSTGVAKATGLGMIGYADSLDRLNPDICIVLGDRFEALAFAYTSFVKKIPLVHISGGELTEALIDDSIRHSITKFAHIHLVATKEYKKRVIQLGEEPSRVYNVGEIGLIGMKNNLLSKEEFEKSINFKLNNKNILFTYHPETLDTQNIKKNIKEILSALSKLKGTNIIFTKANADEGGKIINEELEKFVKKNKNSVLFDSLGRRRYLSALQFVDVVMGNSSSGLVEVPSFKIATINIGNRQKGRIKAKSVIDVKIDKNDILDAINKIYTKEFQKKLQNIKNHYEKDDALPFIINLLKTIDLKKIINKKFYDLEC